MSEHDLTPGEFKQQYTIEIAKANTFKTHGVTEQVALDYLETPEGEKFLRLLKDADPDAPLDAIADRAIGQIKSGRDLPRMEVINEPLVKIVPRDAPLSEVSPYFTRLSEFEDALAKGHSLHDRFGLLIKTEAPVYDVYRIDPKGPAEVFISEVAPTSELGGKVTHAGGGTQYLVPNRKLFFEGTHITSLGNDLALHNELVVGKGLGAPIAAETAAAARSLRPGMGVAAKGLGVAAAAATAYDIADTAHDVGRLRAQGNETAAEDRITRFAAQNLGGWGGAAAGFGAGAMAGVESGPGLLVTGAVGGVIGAVAGDEVATWSRDHKINHQDDRQGKTWTFDPDHPERGWTRTEGNLLDRALGRSRTLTADAALSDELTYQASSRSIALALGAPPQNQDPYRLAVEAADVKQRQPFETGRAWTRDPQTRQWHQEITELVDGRVPVTRHEPASPQQAEALEQRSQAIIARNAQHTPAVMAAQYVDAYERNGWSQHGPVPEAVAKALRHPGQVVGSDGNLYERNAQGQWTHDGTLWDSRANGSLRQELEATHQAQQQASTPVTTLDPVVVRPDPRGVQERQAPQSTPPAPGPSREPPPNSPALPADFAPAMKPSADLRDRNHPGHDAFARTLSEVHNAETTRGIPNGPHSERVAAALMLEAVRNGHGITNVEIGREGRIVGLERGSMMAPAKQVSIDSNQALSMSMEQYAAQWAQLRSPHYARQAPDAERTPGQTHALGRLSPRDQAMFARIREGVPPHIADDVVASAMLQAKKDGIHSADQIDRIALAGDKLWIAGTIPGFRTAVDVSAQAPSLQETAQQTQVFNQQREQQLALEANQREQQQAQGRGFAV